MRRAVFLLIAAAGFSTAAWAAYESSFGIRAIPGHLFLGKPVNTLYTYEFSYGLSSFAGAWTAHAGGGKGDGAALEAADGVSPADQALRFSFRLEPGGDIWALLLFRPGRFSPIDLKRGDGFFFRARTNGTEMDGYPARWFLQARVRDPAGRYVSYRTEDFEVLNVWQTYYVSALDFGREGQAGLFADGSSSARLFDACFLPNTEKYRHGDLVLDAFSVFCPGPKKPGVDTDGDGLPDPVDGDGDDDGILDFARAKDGPLSFTRRGYVQGGGSWEGRFTISDRALSSGETLVVDASLRIESLEIARAVPAIPELVGLLVGECRYDKDGRWHAFTNHQMSSLLTPSGLPIENYQDLVPSRHVLPASGAPYSSPIDAVCRVPIAETRKEAGVVCVDFSFRVPIGAETPEGHWWLYFEFGAVDQTGYFTRLDSMPYDARRAGLGELPASTARDENLVYEKKFILPMIRVGKPAVPRMPWALLLDREVHGVRGIVPEEERGSWALNARNRLGAEPLYPPGVYNLEPGFPDLAYPALNYTYPMNARSGEVSVQVTGPDGKTADLGTAPFQALTTWGATTRTGKYLFDFREYGEYRVRMKGWILDAYGNRHEGGGTYRLWIAERITFGTFPSLPYTVGQGFLGALEVTPPVPADVSLTIEFYPESDAARRQVFSVSGKANSLGLFVSPKPYAFPGPGEYFSRIEASYRDGEGRLWKGCLWGANVVAPADAPLVVRGSTGYMRNGGYVETEARFALGEEGSEETGLIHFLYYPFNAGDVLYVASTMDHRNAIFPHFTMEFSDGFVPYGGLLGRLPYYPVFPTTASGNSPFCFPKGINRLAYFYADAWRPGISGRHVIGCAQSMNTYWSTSPSLLGRQFHTCENADLPGDFYRFTGGLVYRDLETGKASYGIYHSMGQVTPKGTKNNRVTAPCEEPLMTLDGREIWLFLGGGVLPIPGVFLSEGGASAVGGAVNPPVTADLETRVISPSGVESAFTLKANAFGIFPRGQKNAALGEPGVWTATQRLSHAGKTGDVLGTRDGKYHFYVLPKEPGRFFLLNVDLPSISRIEPGKAVRFAGTLPADLADGTLYWTVISPGVILEEGSRPVSGGTFECAFDPWATGRRIPFYDTMDCLTGLPLLCDTVLVSLFVSGKRKDGTPAFGAKLVPIRGDLVLNIPLDREGEKK